MNKARISTVFLAILLISVMSAFAPYANAQAGSVSLKFNAQADGKCFIGYGNPGPGYPFPYDWLGIGKGRASINGHADAVPLEDPSLSYLKILGDTYVSESLSTHGTVTLSWDEEDGDRNQLVATLYSGVSTQGIFVPGADFFSVPLGGPNAAFEELLEFKGIRTVDRVVQKLEGVAILGSMPIGLSPANQNVPPFRSIQLMLYDVDSGKLFMALWLSKTWQIPINGGDPESPTILVPAAKIIQSEVEIKDQIR